MRTFSCDGRKSPSDARLSVAVWPALSLSRISCETVNRTGADREGRFELYSLRMLKATEET